MTEVIADLSEMIHHNSKTTDIAIALLRIDRSYQRTPNQTLVDELYKLVKVDIGGVDALFCHFAASFLRDEFHADAGEFTGYPE